MHTKLGVVSLDVFSGVLQCGVVRCSVLHFIAECRDSAYKRGEVGGWGRDPNKCTGRNWGMGSSTI